jgi:hypothetical protein
MGGMLAYSRNRTAPRRSYRLKRNRTAYGIEFRWTGKPQQQHENTPTME